MHMARTSRPLRASRFLGTLVFAVAALVGTAAAQDGAGPANGQLAVDESVDQALGVLEPLSPVGGLLSFRTILRLPDDPFAFHGRQPFDQQPPAGQSDFSDPDEPVNPRGGKGIP